MINHVRTLLLNQAGPIMPDGHYVGDAYVPRYAAITLGPGFQEVTNTLFGTAPDIQGRLYRVAQYMALLHSTEFKAYVLALDARITYEPQASGLLSLSAGTWVTSSGAASLSVLGDWDVPAALGRLETRWTAEASGNTVDLCRVDTNTQSQELLYFTSGVSQPFSLPDSGLQAVISAPQGVSGDRWGVLRRRLPGYDLGDILASLKLMSSTARQALFGTGTQEPYKTFQNLFDGHPRLPFQMTGVLLALAYRIEALRAP